MKKVLGIFGNESQHWVGDGFPVHSLFSYNSLGKHISPFLLLDHAGPHDFSPTDARRGVGQHPHRGFETVTIVYDGEVEHRDSTGSGGIIGPGDVQWMTAASGILHEEFHSRAFAKRGGKLEMAQLWVNLPARDKDAPAGYQSIVNEQIPTVLLANGAGSVRVIAGEFQDTQGPAQTFTPMAVWDLRLAAGKAHTLRLVEGWTSAVVVLRGSVQINGAERVTDAQVAVLERNGDEVTLEAERDSVILVLSGEPIDEPLVGYGPFVMNTQAEIDQAMRDFQAGKFGRMHAE